MDGVERLLQPWDFFHCPAGTEHVFVGAADGPCVILMVGARSEDEQLLYPVSDWERYGASADEETRDPQQAYARFERPQPGRPSYWGQLPGWLGIFVRGSKENRPSSAAPRGTPTGRIA